MKLKVKPFPAVMTILSGLYLIYVRSMEETAITFDAVGGDPGGKLLPTIMAIFMFVGFLYITIKERPEEAKTEKGTTILFLITLGLSIAYVLLLKKVGFILMSVIMLYALEYVYTTNDEKHNLPDAIIGGVVTTAGTVGVYYGMRYLTKTFLRLARQGTLPSIFSSTIFEGCISAVLISAITTVLALTVCKMLKKKGKDKVANSGLIAFATVLLLYIVFKQFFSVNLAPGLLNY